MKNGGSPGIGIYSTSGQALTLDNWEGGNLAPAGPDTQPPSVPGKNPVATAIGVSQAHRSLDGVNGYGGGDELSRGAAGPRKPEFCAGGDEHRDELQRHGIGRGERLQLSGRATDSHRT